MYSGRGYNEVNIGDRYDGALTLTETLTYLIDKLFWEIVHQLVINFLTRLALYCFDDI